MGAWAALTAAIALVYRFAKTKGVTETGDEPSYLIVARAVSHLTVHPLSAYEADIRTGSLFHWAAGTPLTNLSLQLYTGPRGQVSIHPIGLSVFLSPFVAFGGAALGRLAVMALLAATFVYAFGRTRRLVGLGPGATVAFAAACAAPALWLAATQIYPDLLTGTLIAVVVADLATAEAQRSLRWVPLTVSTAALAALPWLHQQNLVPAVVLVAGFALLHRRITPLSLGVLVSISVVSWILLLVYNQLEYGHLLGLPQPFPWLRGSGVTQILGLFFDRQQGMIVQVPTVLIGVAGLWAARRTTRWQPRRRRWGRLR